MSLLPSEQMIPRIAAILPAAGLSRRMGQPKLMLSLGGRTVISRVIESLRRAGIMQIVVVVREDDSRLLTELSQLGVTVVQPSPPPAQMRDSVEAGLNFLKRESHSWAGWLLIPADHPSLQAPVIRQLIENWVLHPTQIAIPTYQGRRGHPTLFPWSCTSEVFELPTNLGLNSLVRARPERITEVAVDSSEVLLDLDTPEDWQELKAAWDGEPRQNLPNAPQM